MNLSVTKSLPKQAGFEEFMNFPRLIYPAGSPRFILGHDPVEQYLEGCYLIKSGEQPVARFALYNNPELRIDESHAVSFGSFECIDDQQVALFVVRTITKLAEDIGVSTVIGPMEGSTWNSYRFSDSNALPNFFMEPFHHDYYGTLLEKCGFSPLYNYVSNLDTALNYNPERIIEYEAYLTNQGARLRTLNTDILESELKRIGEFSNDAFRKNELFTHLDPELFSAKYISLSNYFDPALILILEDSAGCIQGISFSIKDYSDSKGETLIIKSLARRPNAPFRGLGGYLTEKTYEAAVQLGYKRVIHAFMITDNHSVKMSQDYTGQNFKTYTLYGKEI